MSKEDNQENRKSFLDYFRSNGTADEGEMMGDNGKLERWSCYHFSQSNPSGPGQGSVPALLRRVAETMEKQGDIEVQDIVFGSVPTAGEPDLHMTVYYTLPDLYVVESDL